MNNETSRITDWSAGPAVKLGEIGRGMAFVGQSIEQIIKRYPATAVTLSIGLGALLGWLIKRR